MATFEHFICTIFLFITLDYVVADECRDGWLKFQGSCYLVMKIQSNWLDAESYCRVLNGYLLEINNADEDHFVQNLIKDKSLNLGVWTGGNDFEVPGSFVWAHSHSRMHYTNWSSGKPSSTGHVDDCVHITQETTQFKWNNTACMADFNFICESEPIPVVPRVIG